MTGQLLLFVSSSECEKSFPRVIENCRCVGSVERSDTHRKPERHRTSLGTLPNPTYGALCSPEAARRNLFIMIFVIT
jgi:hypothetical protein